MRQVLYFGFFVSATVMLAQDVAPRPSTSVQLTSSVITTTAALKAAVATPGTYDIAPGTYTANLTVTAPGVRLRAVDGVILQASDFSKPALQVSASGFSLSGPARVQGAANEGIVVGSQTATSASSQPDGVLIDGVSVVAPAAGGLRGFALHGSHITLSHVRVEGYYRTDREVQGVWINNGPGPYTLTDSYIEGAGENMMVGGAPVSIVGNVPSDILIARNVFFKPQTWRTNGAIVKNIFELKNARRVTIVDNVFDGNWKAAQPGHAIVFTARNTAAAEQGLPGNPWVTVDAIVFRHNVIRNSRDGYGINILGHDDGGRPSEQTKSITIEDNLCEHCTNGIQVGSGVTENLTIRRNTFPAITGTIVLFADSTTKTALTMTENTGKTGPYAVILSGAAKGIPSLTAACSTYTMTGNVLERSVYGTPPVTASIPLPVGNVLLAPGAMVWDANYVMSGGSAGWSGPVLP